jgi:hypothetical protein
LFFWQLEVRFANKRGFGLSMEKKLRDFTFCVSPCSSCARHHELFRLAGTKIWYFDHFISPQMTTLYSLRHFEQQFSQTFMPTALEQKPGQSVLPAHQQSRLEVCLLFCLLSLQSRVAWLLSLECVFGVQHAFLTLSCLTAPHAVPCTVNKHIREFSAALRACVDRLSADVLQFFKVWFCLLRMFDCFAAVSSIVASFHPAN